MCNTNEIPTDALLNRRSALAGLSGAAVIGLAACTTERAPEAVPVQSAVTVPVSAGKPEPGLEVVFLGTQAGPPVESDRSGISTALRVDDSIYVVDCGRSATTQFMKAGLKFGSLKSIFITHLHADHLADYYNFFLLAGSAPNSKGDRLSGPVRVYGPGPAGGLPPKFGGGEAATVAPENPTPGIRALTEKSHEAFAYSHNVFIRSSNLRDVRELADVHDIELPPVGADFHNDSPAMEPFLVMEDEKVKVTATLVPHGHVFPCFAYRFETAYGSVTFSGDTTYSDNLIVLASGTDLLVHEAVNVQGAENIPPALRNHLLEAHVEVQQVGPIAEKAGASKLVLSHIGDLSGKPLDARQWKTWAQKGYRGEVVIAEDLQRISIGHPAKG